MTDNEIIEALKRCPQHTECCYCNSLEECGNKRILTTSVLDLINRQKAIIEKSEKFEHFVDKTIETANAEIERLNIELQSMRNAANSYKMELERLKSEIEEANEVDRKAEIQALKESKENAKLFCEAINNAKSEVVKEFIKNVDKLLERYSHIHEDAEKEMSDVIEYRVKRVKEENSND